MINLNLSDGEYVAHVRFMASIPIWRKSGEGGMEDFEFDQAIFNLADLRTGWANFPQGEAPEWAFDKSLGQRRPKPDDRDWKRGFKMVLYSESLGLREFAATTAGPSLAIQDLMNVYGAESPNHAGQLPVVKYEGAKFKKIGKGSTHQPIFKIIDWEDWPEEMLGDKGTSESEPKAESSLDDLDDKIDL